ncbi:hypothetical protein COO60DRAFT_1103137 [Scenedesmus sp. NREL 46B-D3]|nr:hypothetical protein COO60DRAFT_1103137 [Scenedesmus sp. NREL 46B-D3]
MLTGGDATGVDCRGLQTSTHYTAQCSKCSTHIARIKNDYYCYCWNGAPATMAELSCVKDSASPCWLLVLHASTKKCFLHCSDVLPDHLMVQANLLWAGDAQGGLFPQLHVALLYTFLLCSDVLPDHLIVCFNLQNLLRLRFSWIITPWLLWDPTSLVWLLSGWACGPTLVFGIWYFNLFRAGAAYGWAVFHGCMLPCSTLEPAFQNSRQQFMSSHQPAVD